MYTATATLPCTYSSYLLSYSAYSAYFIPYFAYFLSYSAHFLPYSAYFLPYSAYFLTYSAYFFQCYAYFFPYSAYLYPYSAYSAYSASGLMVLEAGHDCRMTSLPAPPPASPPRPPGPLRRASAGPRARTAALPPSIRPRAGRAQARGPGIP